MLEALNNIGGKAQPFRLHQKSEKHPPQSCQNKHETMWQSCFIATNSTSKTAVDIVPMNWKLPELTYNELK